MDLCPLKALVVTNYEARLPDNTLMYSYYMCQKGRLYVEDKIVFEAHEDHDFFLHFSHILLYDLKVVILLSLKLY